MKNIGNLKILFDCICYFHIEEPKKEKKKVRFQDQQEKKQVKSKNSCSLSSFVFTDDQFLNNDKIY